MVILEPEKREESQSQSPESSENPSHSDPQKKTRDLPNLTECHACGFKIDVCTGKNKLQTLYSEWRVVLLCKKCFSCVKSSQICSYCFSESSSDSLRCVKCKNSVHKNCFLKNKNVAPWSYSCVGSEFSVCVDCWVPKHVEVSRRRKMRSLRKVKSGVIVKKGRVDLVKESSRVLKGGNLMRSMEDVAKDANQKVKKKVEAATRARDVASKKAVAARRAVELANKTLNTVANREEGTLNLPSKMDPVKVVGCSNLAFDLRLNNSPMISKSCCLLNTNASKRWTFSVDSSCKTSNSRSASGSLRSLDSDSSTDLSCPCMGRCDMITSPKDGECTAELKEGEGSCSDRLINLSGENSALHGEERSDRYFFKYVRRKSDRYFFKYSRRKSDRYFLKYSRSNCLKPNLDS